MFKLFKWAKEPNRLFNLNFDKFIDIILGLNKNSKDTLHLGMVHDSSTIEKFWNLVFMFYLNVRMKCVYIRDQHNINVEEFFVIIWFLFFCFWRPFYLSLWFQKTETFSTNILSSSFCSYKLPNIYLYIITSAVLKMLLIPAVQ